VNTHDAGGGHSDIWDYIDGLSAQISDLTRTVQALGARVGSLEAQAPGGDADAEEQGRRYMQARRAPYLDGAQ
jgi:hypothetical protein